MQRLGGARGPGEEEGPFDGQNSSTEISWARVRSIERFLERYTAAGIQMEVEDILVNGAPWKARAAVRAHVWSPGPDGADRHSNRAVLAVQTRWGKIVGQEDDEDTERVGAFDELLTSAEATASA